MPVFDYKGASSGGYKIGTATGTLTYVSSLSKNVVTFPVEAEPAAFIMWCSQTNNYKIAFVRYDGSVTYTAYYDASDYEIIADVTGLVNVAYSNGQLTLTPTGTSVTFPAGTKRTFNLRYLY